MRVTVNGEPHTLPENTTAQGLTDILQVHGRVALEINHAVLPRHQWQDHALSEGDAIEVVRAIGGG